MSDFFDFVKNQKLPASRQIGATPEGSKTILELLTGSGKTVDQASIFTRNVTEIAASDEFLKPVSDSIGAPLAGETEDEFVARAKATIVQHLKKKLGQT